MEKFFTLTKFYNTGKGLTHLKHALREKYDTEKIPEPKIALLKYENGQLKEATKQEIYDMYEYNKLHRYRQKNNLYFEQVISKYDFSKLPELGEYLSIYFEGRPVYFILHMDESQPHSHNIIFFKDPEHDKAPRIQKKHLVELSKNTARIIEQKYIMPGAGTHKHIKYTRDPQKMKELLEAEKMEAKRREEIKDQIEMLLEVMSPIQVTVTDPKNKTTYYLKNAEGQDSFYSIDEVPIQIIDRLLQRGMKVDIEAFQMMQEQNKKEELKREYQRTKEEAERVKNTPRIAQQIKNFIQETVERMNLEEHTTQELEKLFRNVLSKLDDQQLYNLIFEVQLILNQKKGYFTTMSESAFLIALDQIARARFNTCLTPPKPEIER